MRSTMLTAAAIQPRFLASVRPKMRLGLEFVETREKILLED
jgi:hypothetical protein